MRHLFLSSRELWEVRPMVRSAKAAAGYLARARVLATPERYAQRARRRAARNAPIAGVTSGETVIEVPAAPLAAVPPPVVPEALIDETDPPARLTRVPRVRARPVFAPIPEPPDRKSVV